MIKSDLYVHEFNKLRLNFVKFLSKKKLLNVINIRVFLL